MNKAFIFDFDGVIIDIEPSWEKVKKEMFPRILGKDVYEKLGSTVGVSISGTYNKARELGSTVTKEELTNAFHQNARRIYQDVPITPGIQDLLTTLRKEEYKIGLVTASPLEWITIVLKRIPYMKFDFFLSAYERKDIPPKPAPDGYIEAMKFLNATPQSTCILEDSNAGIASAKASGAFTIGFRQNLIKGYEQVGADVYADTMEEVIKIVLDRELQ